MKNLKIYYSSVSGSQKLYIRSRDGDKIIDIDKIIFCEAKGNCTIIISEDEEVKICNSLCEVEEPLKAYAFLRCHYSFLVNLKKAKLFCRKLKNIKVSEYVIPISKRKVKDVIPVLVDYGIKENKK